MIDPVQHLLLFAAVSLVIVTIGAFYGERDDRRAFASVPRRFANFVIGCGILTAIMLACEHLFASVS